MTHEILDNAALRNQLFQRVTRLEVRCALVFGVAPADATAIYAVTDDFLARLRGTQGTRAAVEAATRLQQELFDPFELATSAFWATALGRAVGYWTGGNERWDGTVQLGVPQVEAAAVLGMTRQGVNEATKRQRLEACKAGVTALSVADYMHARYPLAAAA